jgi:hypothetical protein
VVVELERGVRGWEECGVVVAEFGAEAEVEVEA